MRKRALISVSDKRGLVELAMALKELEYELVSTGGTAKILSENGFAVTLVETVTGFPECLDGRVKTLHPAVFAGVLALRDSGEHMETLKNFGIAPVDVVVVNLYPFAETAANPANTRPQIVEQVDIGGPSLIRAAAKNYRFVAVVTDPEEYGDLISRLRENRVDEDYRLYLAARAFGHTAAYDAIIAQYFNDEINMMFPEKLTLTFQKRQEMRYGENPHQLAAYYTSNRSCFGLETAEVLQGKALSFNNIHDAQSAVALTKEFEEPVCVAVKHATPCGVGTGETVLEAYKGAYDCDPGSIFGGIICVNRELGAETAKLMAELFLEVIIAPAYSKAALKILKAKKNLRLLLMPELSQKPSRMYEFKSEGGGMLIQQADLNNIADEPHTLVTETPVPEEAEADLIFAMKVVKHVKSNAIVVAKQGRTLGIGGGEVSRIWAAEQALSRAGEAVQGAVLASDAMFPLPDVVEACAAHGIRVIIQPGGSIKDKLSIEACDKHGIAMLFTGMRHFRH